MRSKLVLLLILLLLVTCQSATIEVAPVLMNPGFEEGWWLETTFWTLDGGPFHDQFVEITPGEEWTAWWIEGPLCTGTTDWRQGRPEVRVIDGPDPYRIHSGDQATMFFTFWWCHNGGLFQTVSVEPGKFYTVQAFGHAWFSECDLRPHNAPYEKDCKTPLNWAQLKLRICVDPLGGTDPTVCSDWEEIYGKYGDPLVLRHFEAISSTATVFLESLASHPLKHVDVYWDDVSISESYQVFLPVIVGGIK